MIDETKTKQKDPKTYLYSVVPAAVFSSQVLLFLTERWRMMGKDDRTRGRERRRKTGEVGEFLCLTSSLEEERRCVEAGSRWGERERERWRKGGKDKIGLGSG